MGTVGEVHGDVHGGSQVRPGWRPVSVLVPFAEEGDGHSGGALTGEGRWMSSSIRGVYLSSE